MLEIEIEGKEEKQMTLVTYLNQLAEQNNAIYRFKDVSDNCKPSIDPSRICIARFQENEMQDALEVDRWAIKFIYDNFKGYTRVR